MRDSVCKSVHECCKISDLVWSQDKGFCARIRVLLDSDSSFLLSNL